jgi:nucleoside-diphosphate-sugar epimerase
MKSILITGSNGYIARNIQKYLQDYKLFLTDRSNLNLLNSNDVDNFFSGRYFDAVLHTAVNGGSRLDSDDCAVFHNNVLMHYNLMKNSANFGKYINLGSGAELDRSKNIDLNSSYIESFPNDHYGLSKNIIARTGHVLENFYNVRIFNVFNEDELPTRMIRNSITNYLNKEKIIIHQNRYMDFMYFDDFAKILNYVISSNDCPKTINCSYQEKYLLSEIADIINNLNNYKVEIEIQNKELGFSYVGKSEIDKLDVKFDGLRYGIEKCYRYHLENK